MKPWEETWVCDGDLTVDRIDPDARQPPQVLAFVSHEGAREADAHARATLAAAAPDLYRALEAIVSGNYERFNEVNAQASAALRKARGET
jgi:hypothetical protein